MSAIGRVLAPIRRLVPNLGEISHAERLRASAGALIGLLITGFVSRAALGTTDGLPLLIAPMGASAVLLFAVPSSPLAQPWSILGGNVVAALIGITCGRFLPDPIAAAALACACAIGAMLLLRCLHPPSGAVALTAVLGGPTIHAAGYMFAIWPVALNSLLLLLAAVAFNNATGRRYPHLAPPAGRTPATSPEKSNTAVVAVLRRHNEILDVDRNDLVDLLHEIEDETQRGRLEDVSCAAIMNRDVVSVSPRIPIEEALAHLSDHRLGVLAVQDEDGQLVGTLTQSDILKHLRPTAAGRTTAKLFRRSIRFDMQPRTVGDIVKTPLKIAAPDCPIADLVPVMIDFDLPHIPIVDKIGRLVGIVAQVDVIKALYSP